MTHRICDYEGSEYRRLFWEEANRSYEDATERRAVGAMLPPSGQRLLDIGAGFGRLVDLYSGYREVLLLDYARSMLADARRLHGDRCRYVCADLYRLPLATGALDTVVQVRVLHHVERIEDAVGEVARALRGGGSYVLEFANKRHVKAVVRYALRRQAESPFTESPYEFVSLNWNFHPRHVARALDAAGLAIVQRRAVSHFRSGALKRFAGARTLASLDAALGPALAPLALAPSVFYRAESRAPSAASPNLWRCPACGHEPLREEGDAVPCRACRRVWPIVDGIHVFREGVPEAAIRRL